MGATNFVEEAMGFSAEECFGMLCGEAIYENGNDSYNGTISTCSLGSKRLSFSKYSKANEKKAYDYINKEENGQKWSADYIDLGVVEYEVITYKKKHTGNTPEYKMKYTVKIGYFDDITSVRSFDTKKEADDYAIMYAVKNGINTRIRTVKEYVLINGEDTTTMIEVESKTYKSKPKLKPMPNRTIREVHKYLFYGWAAC